MFYCFIRSGVFDPAFITEFDHFLFDSLPDHPSSSFPHFPGCFPAHRLYPLLSRTIWFSAAYAVGSLQPLWFHKEMRSSFWIPAFLNARCFFLSLMLISFLPPFRQTSPLRGLNVYRPVSDQGLYAPGHCREETGPFVRFSVAIGTVFIIKAGKKISVPLKGTSKAIIHLKRYIFIQIRNVHLKLASQSSCFVLQ